MLIGALPASEPSRFGDSRYDSFDTKCGRCGALLMAGDAVCYTCRRPVGRADDVAASPVMWVVATVAAGLGYVAVKMLLPW